jgi:hypothetical protein
MINEFMEILVVALFVLCCYNKARGNGHEGSTEIRENEFCEQVFQSIDRSIDRSHVPGDYIRDIKTKSFVPLHLRPRPLHRGGANGDQ